MSYFHNRHVRHQPPFREAAWVLDEDGRQSHIGAAIECPLCDRAEFPEGLVRVGHVTEWTGLGDRTSAEQSIPRQRKSE